jgi:biopolymer transport protein ExbD
MDWRMDALYPLALPGTGRAQSDAGFLPERPAFEVASTMFSAAIGALVHWLRQYLLPNYLFRRLRIFISYRREDLPEVAALAYRAVVDEYKSASVFLDVDTIVAGDDFPQAIKKSINASDHVIAIVGPRWIGPMPNGAAPRIQNVNDFVRLELEEAIRARKPLMVLHWGAMPPAADIVPPSLNRVLRPKWTNVSERQLRQLIGREMRHRRRSLSWVILISMFCLQMAAWITTVPIAMTIFGGVAQKRADAVALTVPKIGEEGRPINDPVIGPTVVSIAADGKIYVFDQEVSLTSVAKQVRAVLDQCRPACDARVFIRGDRRANPATVFGVASRLKGDDLDLAFVGQAKD